MSKYLFIEYKKNFKNSTKRKLTTQLKMNKTLATFLKKRWGGKIELEKMLIAVSNQENAN